MPNVIRLRPARQAPCVEVTENLVRVAKQLAAVASDTSHLDVDVSTKNLMLQSLVAAARALQHASQALSAGVSATAPASTLT